MIVVCPSVMEGQQKQFDLETQGTVSLTVERKKLEIGNLCGAPVKAVATGTNIGFLDRPYKKQATMDTSIHVAACS